MCCAGAAVVERKRNAPFLHLKLRLAPRQPDEIATLTTQSARHAYTTGRFSILNVSQNEIGIGVWTVFGEGDLMEEIS